MDNAQEEACLVTQRGTYPLQHVPLTADKLGSFSVSARQFTIGVLLPGEKLTVQWIRDHLIERGLYQRLIEADPAHDDQLRAREKQDQAAAEAFSRALSDDPGSPPDLASVDDLAPPTLDQAIAGFMHALRDLEAAAARLHNVVAVDYHLANVTVSLSPDARMGSGNVQLRLGRQACEHPVAPFSVAVALSSAGPVGPLPPNPAGYTVGDEVIGRRHVEAAMEAVQRAQKPGWVS